jgi:hypothetical protein
MDFQNYYVKNLESGKLNVFTTKAYYDQLSNDQKKAIKNFCLWSKKMDCWVSKGKAENCGYLKSKLTELQFEDRGTIGERLSFEEQVSRQQTKAVGRVERSEVRAEKAEKKSDQLFDKAKEMASIIPFGQPILVGHHSEKRDRNYRDRIHNTFGKAFEEQEKAEYYSGKAETARYTADGKKFKNPVYLNNRLKECDKNIRLLERRLKGKFYTYSPEQQISDKSREFYTSRLKEEQDKKAFYVKCMKAINPDFLEDNVSSKRKGKSQGLS